MKVNEKVNLIDSIENINSPDSSYFKILKKFSYDKNSFVRSRCAALLINFETAESLKILLRLSNDKDAFVRTEAYDSLGIFYFPEVEKTLFRAINLEKDCFAKQYSILSWADVVSQLHDDFKENIIFVQNIIDNNQTEDYDSCHIRLSCYYALKLFGCDVINNIFDFLNSEEYTVRCSALNLLNDVADDANRELIRSAVVELLKTEKNVAVKCEAEKVLNEL